MNGFGLQPVPNQTFVHQVNGHLPQVSKTPLEVKEATVEEGEAETQRVTTHLLHDSSSHILPAIILFQIAVEIPNLKRVKARRDSQYPTKRDHMICKCLSLSITYAATIGGLITITGTSTNLIFAEQFNT